VDSRDRLPLIHEQPSSQKQSHQEREKNQQNQTKKDFESTEPTFRIENREKKSREIDRRSSCTSECLSSLVSSLVSRLSSFVSHSAQKLGFYWGRSTFPRF